MFRYNDFSELQASAPDTNFRFPMNLLQLLIAVGIPFVASIHANHIAPHNVRDGIPHATAKLR